jgi:hypothetical protein
LLDKPDYLILRDGALYEGLLVISPDGPFSCQLQRDGIQTESGETW